MTGIFDKIADRANVVVVRDEVVKNRGEEIEGVAELTIQALACRNVVIIEDELVLIYSEEDDVEWFRSELLRLELTHGDVIYKTIVFTMVDGKLEAYV